MKTASQKNIKHPTSNIQQGSENSFMLFRCGLPCGTDVPCHCNSELACGHQEITVATSVMGNKDPRIDAYIAKSADFAKPILKHIRKLVHAACPDVEETMKWSMPYFMHKGILCSMAAFQSHCSFRFWKGALIFGKGRAAGNKQADGMGQFGRIRDISDLPKDKVLIGYVKQAVRLNETGAKLTPRLRPKEKKELIVPTELMSALKENKRALAAFENFSYSHKKEYVEWITEAKREETRKKRLETAVEWITNGKPRHWKYVKC